MLLKYKKCTNCDTYYEPTLKKCPDCHKINELYQEKKVPRHIAFLHPIAQGGLFLGGFSYAGMLLLDLIVSVFALQFTSDKGVLQAVVNSVVYFLMFDGLLGIVLFTRKKYFFDKFTNGLNYAYGIGYAITLVLIGSAFSSIISIFHEVSDNANQEAAISYAQNYPILAFFVVGIIGPLCEELTYRVGLYSFLRRINKYLAIAVTTVVFAFIHFNFDPAGIVDELWALPSYLVAGLILTLAYEHRGPVCSMTAHVLYNVFAFLVILAS